MSRLVHVALVCGAVAGCSACDAPPEGATSIDSGDVDSASGGSGTGSTASGATGGAGAAVSGGTGGGTGGSTADGGGWQPNPADWKTPAWNPTGCNYLQAIDAKQALPPMPWVECDNGVSGCIYLDTSLVPGRASVVGSKVAHVSEVTTVNGPTQFTLLFFLATYDHAAVILDLKGPIAAWRAPDSLTGCALGEARFGQTPGASLRPFHKLSGGGIASQVVYGSVESMLSGQPAWLDFDNGPAAFASIMEVHFSKDLMAFLTLAPKALYTWDYAGEPKAIPKPAGVSEDVTPIVSGKELLFTREFKGLAVRHDGGSVELLHSKPGVWVTGLQSDYVDLTWEELDQNGILEAWTSPFATSAAAFKPRKIRVVDGIQNTLVASAMGEGWWVYRKDEVTLRAVRISDGYWVDAPPPKGMGFQQPIDVVDGEIWSILRPTPNVVSANNSIVRVPIASLGTPKP
ncbi:MAG: hypothetical protein R3B13_04565 [Polyangiaceae bacterium]